MASTATFTAVRAVLEAHRAGQAAGQLAVALALGGACADGGPAHQVADVLGTERSRNSVPTGRPSASIVQQQQARALQPSLMAKAAVQVRVVDIALPAHGGARLLEYTRITISRSCASASASFQQPRVLHGLVMVVDGTGPDDDDQPVILAVQHARDSCRQAGLHQRLARPARAAIPQDGGRDQGRTALMRRSSMRVVSCVLGVGWGGR